MTFSTRTKKRPTSDKYRNDRTVKLPCRYTNNRAEKVVEKKRKGLKPIGRKGEFNAFVHLVLNRFFHKRGVEGCEIPYAHNCWSDIHHSHSEKRRRIPVGAWRNAFTACLMCNNEHDEWELKGADVNREFVLSVIKLRDISTMNWRPERNDELLLEAAEEILAENPKITFDIEEIAAALAYDPRPFPIDFDEVGADGNRVWTVTEE